MSALLELIKEAPPEDRRKAAEMLKPYLKEKAPSAPEWIGVKEFRLFVPGHKSSTWLRLYLFPYVDWVVNPNPGRGGKTLIDKVKALKWLDQHSKDINWHKPLPKG